MKKLFLIPNTKISSEVESFRWALRDSCAQLSDASPGRKTSAEGEEQDVGRRFKYAE